MPPTLTLLTIPVIDLRRASQDSRRYSALLRSCAVATWRVRSRAGGVYPPPECGTLTWQTLPSHRTYFSFFFASPFLPCLAPSRVQRRPCIRWAGAHDRLCGRRSRRPLPSERLLIYTGEAEERATRATSRQDHREQRENETCNLSIRTWKAKMGIETRAYLFLFVMPLF